MSNINKKWDFKQILIIIIVHIVGLYGMFTFPYFNKKLTFSWMILCYTLTALGVTGGAHRLWSHNSYKAKWPVRLLLAIFFYSSCQFTLFNWVRFHRAHHKYTETDADPTNTKRGFFFAHIGWLMMEKHPECIEKMRKLDMTDIKTDKIIYFGDKYFGFTTLICAVILPSVVPIIFWNETLYWSIMSQVFMRLLLTSHSAASGNSFLHMWGTKPYNRNIDSMNNKIINIFTLGDGWHNYHHTFPWDYKSAEFGFYQINFITFFIESFAKIGWTYDLKEASSELIKMTCERKGDGSHPLWKTEIPYCIKKIIIMRIKNLIFKRILIILLLHIIGIYGIFTFPYFNKKLTFGWLIVCYILTALGITGGAHRLWSHNSYKAKWPVRLLLAIFFYSSLEFTLFNWVRFHRVHHKYTDTDADPTNTKRGFFFAHIGWLMMKIHPECIKKMQELDMSDIKADKIIYFGDKYYGLTSLICAIILPSVVPIIFWNETLYWSIMSQVFMRLLLVTHVAGISNSFLHMWGTQPYNRNIGPRNNRIINIFTLGDGWHNYHHTFPWDYKSAEYGLHQMNFLTFFIESFAKIGWTYDLKEASSELIKMTCKRKGDGSHPLWKTEIPYCSN
ncbi:uncharacterized protein LOC127290040 [Leptopilina boulardi]|uniref:uncharacterized protein LOC127290040 n=1 Tax=Leptopilina boulardi TaxID=63433 RepID=UPI0021F5A4BE|nr:uncharacterized protein LOC127290040 [Leptopilina boulardi]